jgi:predicted DCC family thiol-disulfide oxidoreductase YuxK
MPDDSHVAAPIVIFDGSCGMCSRAVSFFLKRDKEHLLVFVSNLSDYGRSMLQRYGLEADTKNTIIVIDGDATLVRSEAVLYIASQMCAPYRWISCARVIPRPVRDLIYRCIAAARYRLERPHAWCTELSPELRRRIIDQ